MTTALVTGAAGFIGHHLAAALKAAGRRVRGVDLRPPEFGAVAADEFEILDLRREEDARRAARGVDEVYALAADMGGMGYISCNHAAILHGNLLIDLNTVHAAAEAGARRLFYASSACVYPEGRQERADAPPLREEDAWPAQPQDAYGLEKLVGEQLCARYAEEGRIETRVARFHNVFGPEGSWRGGREKAPAALCRKVAVAKLAGTGVVEVWGDGEQTRSFCHVDDCVEGIRRLMESAHAEPLNLGSDRMVTVNEMLRMVAGIAGVEVEARHVPGPQGVRGRNSDNARLRSVLGWEPRLALEDGLARTYAWVEEQVRRELEDGVPVEDLAAGRAAGAPA